MSGYHVALDIGGWTFRTEEMDETRAWSVANGVRERLPPKVSVNVRVVCDDGTSGEEAAP